MVDKYLKIDATTGLTKEQSASDTSSGVGDAGKLVALASDGLISPTMLQSTETLSLVASENLAAGDFVNFWNDTGTLKMRKAVNTASSTRADAYVKSSVTSGNAGIAYRDSGTLTGLSSLTVGSPYFLGTGGGITTTPPSASGSIVQLVGTAKSTTELIVRIEEPKIRE